MSHKEKLKAVSFVLKASWDSYLTDGFQGLHGRHSGKEPTCQCRRQKKRGSDPEVGKIEGKATHSSILAWRITDRGSGELQSVGSQRVRHD